MKPCTKCGEPKELKEFNRNAASKDGYDYWCKNCKSLKNATYPGRGGRINRWRSVDLGYWSEQIFDLTGNRVVFPDNQIAIRLFAKVKITDKGCWEWQGANSSGYGRFRIGYDYYSVHRVVYSWVFSVDFNSETVVCHHCDNPGCVNPSHLFLGTMSDNSQDRERKGRGWKGKTGLYSSPSVPDILQLIRDGVSAYSIAKQYGARPDEIYYLARKNGVAFPNRKGRRKTGMIGEGQKA